MLKILLLLISIIAIQSEDRLILFNSSYSVWMPEEEVLKLVSENRKFMDITDYPVIQHMNRVVPNYPDQPLQQKLVFEYLPFLNALNLRKTVTDLSNFQNRYFASNTGLQGALYLRDQYTNIAISSGYPNIQVGIFSNSFLQPSVIARIPGEGPNANELVIIGGHLDSLANPNPMTSRAPGADDDATGCATALEVFRALVELGFKPNRTLEFHGYASEEVGHRGSQAIANAYAARGVVVYAMLNVDMTGYVKEGTQPTLAVMTDFTNHDLTDFVKKLAGVYTNLPVSETMCGGGTPCSDNASWDRVGYPASFIFESIFEDRNPYIHTINDDPSKLNFNHALEFAKLALGFAIELSVIEEK